MQNPNNGETALHEAVRKRDLKSIELLSNQSADPTINNMYLETPLSIAIDNGDDDIIDLLAPETPHITLTRSPATPYYNFTSNVETSKKADGSGMQLTGFHWIDDMSTPNDDDSLSTSYVYKYVSIVVVDIALNTCL